MYSANILSCYYFHPALPKSCSHLKIWDSTAESGTYVIDPDGEGGVPPYNVTCDMTNKNGVGVTVVSHDSEDRTLVDGFEAPGSYSRDIKYTKASLSQLASLTTVSLFCKQFIQYECRNSLMFRDNTAWWVSRDSIDMNYWGGAPAGSGKCACRIDDSCAEPHYHCNCDANNDEWNEDSGLLTDKIHLPVKQLRFGDTGSYEEMGYHTLGKFKCYGIA